MGTRCAISRGRQAPACFKDQQSVWQVFGGFADAWVAAIARNKAAITAGAARTAPAAPHSTARNYQTQRMPVLPVCATTAARPVPVQVTVVLLGGAVLLHAAIAEGVNAFESST